VVAPTGFEPVFQP